MSVRKEAPVRRSSSAWSPRQPTTSSTASPGEDTCELRVMMMMMMMMMTMTMMMMVIMVMM